MYLCVNCGVELEDDMKVCPLCGKIASEESGERSEGGSYPSDIIQQYRKESREHYWELSGIFAFTAIIVCTIVDLVSVKGIKWSLYADVSIMAVWTLQTSFIFLLRKPFILIPCITVTIMATLLSFDFFSQGVRWFFKLGMPLTLAAGISISIVVLFFKKVHFRGFNIIAVSLLSASGFCIVAEVFTDLYINGIVDLRWSLIEAASAFPVSLLYFYIHYRLKRGKRLDSFFHV